MGRDLNAKNKGNYNPLHEIIFELNPQHIITTNYDNCFENIIENRGLPFSVVSKDIDLPYAEHKNLLIKYHGDFENKNIVFKETDYLEFSKNKGDTKPFLSSYTAFLLLSLGIGSISGVSQLGKYSVSTIIGSPCLLHLTEHPWPIAKSLNWS